MSRKAMKATTTFCPFCRLGRLRPATATIPVIRGRTTTYLPRVPAQVCPICRDRVVNDEILGDLELRADQVIAEGVTRDCQYREACRASRMIRKRADDA